MAAANPTISTFAGVAPPWSLANLDANFAAVTAIINSINTYTQYAVDTGSANTYVIAFAAGTVVTFAGGLGVVFKAANANTGASTLNVGGTGAKALLRADGSAMVGGEIPAAGICTAISDGTSYFLQSTVVPSTGYVNGLINGGMEVWQRGTSIAVAASANGYTADRWALTTNANQSHTMSQQTGLTNGSQFCIRVQRDSGQTGVGTPIFEQPFELAEIIKYRGQKISVSFVASTGANWSPASGTFTVIIAAGTGAAARRGTSAYTGETVVLTQSQSLAAGGSATAYSATSSVVVPTNTTQMTMYFTWTPVGTAGTNDWISLDDVMWSVGIAPAPFERRSATQERQLCQRYYQKSFLDSVAVATATSVGEIAFSSGNAGALDYGTVTFLVSMRVTPTITLYSPATGASANVRSDTGTADVAATAPNATPDRFSINLTSGANNSYRAHFQAVAEL